MALNAACVGSTLKLLPLKLTPSGVPLTAFPSTVKFTPLTVNGLPSTSLALASKLVVNVALPSDVLIAKAADTTGGLLKANALSAEPMAALPAKSYVVTLA